MAIQAGSAIVFRIRTHARDVGLMLRVSRSSARGKCGVIRGEVARASLARTGTPAVYEARPAGAALSTSWLNTPGTYFWQAYRIAGRDGCVESGVRTLRVVPKPPLALSEARLEGTYDVALQITAVNGFDIEVGETYTTAYTFEPSCPSGPCDTTLTIQAAGFAPGLGGTMTVPLTRTGARYEGSTQAKMSTCAGFTNLITGTLEIRFEVGGGAWMGNTWRAAKVVGHQRSSSPETSVGILKCPDASCSVEIHKCPAASWEADLTGTQSGAGELGVSVTPAPAAASQTRSASFTCAARSAGSRVAGNG